jgi:hypothetical protein
MERLTENKYQGKFSIKGNTSIYPNETDKKKGLVAAVCKLHEYEDLEEQGLLLRLPCKVGDIVWDNDFGKPCSYEVTGFSFGDLNEDDEWCDEALNQVMVFYSNGNGSVPGRFAVSEIGKTVFLTKKEAEQALEKLEREV